MHCPPEVCVLQGLPRVQSQAWLAGTGTMLYHNDTLLEPDSRVRELLLGFHPHDIEAPELSEDQRCHLLGQCIDINLFSWFIRTASPANAIPPSEGTDFGSQVPPALNTPSLPLSVMAPGAFAIERQYAGSQPLPHPLQVLPAARLPPELTLPKAPEPIPWAPQFDPEIWIYTDGSLIEGESRLR